VKGDKDDNAEGGQGEGPSKRTLGSFERTAYLPTRTWTLVETMEVGFRQLDSNDNVDLT
jgi:hypothetical protein